MACLTEPSHDMFFCMGNSLNTGEKNVSNKVELKIKHIISNAFHLKF
jgi:hypothetical protein